MRTMQRAVAMVGLTLMTGGVLGVTATAASAAPSEEKAAGQSVERHGDRDRDWGRGDDRDGRWDRDRDRRYVAGWFRSERACKIAGWIGDRKDKWEDPRCRQVARRTWVLTVERDHHRWGGRH
jgi:hypothetical protein